MKKILILRYLFFFLIIDSAINAQSTNGIPAEKSYAESLQLAQKENKPLFIMLYANWCPHCQAMKNSVLNDASLFSFLNSNFIYLWKDIEKPEGNLLTEKFQTKGLPSFIVVDANETLLYRLKGEQKKETLLQDAKNALNPNFQLPALEKQFLADVSNAINCYNYIILLRKGTDRKTLSIPTHQYLATQKDEQLATELNWRIISNGVTDPQSREFQYVLQHRSDFEKVASVERVQLKIKNIITELLDPYTENLAFENYLKQREIVESINLPYTNELLFNYDLLIAERTSNWTYYQKTSLENVEKMVWSNDTKLKEIGQIYLAHINETSALKTATSWVEHALEINNSYDGNLLAARLFLKLKDKKNALIYAKEAKVFATEMGWKTTDSETVLKAINKL